MLLSTITLTAKSITKQVCLIFSLSMSKQKPWLATAVGRPPRHDALHLWTMEIEKESICEQFAKLYIREIN